MTILGIDTATVASAACVLRFDGAAFEARPTPDRLGERPAHAVELTPAIAGCLEDAGIGWDGFDAVAVGIGPGAFTGLRIGVTTARALASATGVAVHPISSLAALAAGARAAIPEAADRPLLALIDARRGELFAALYEPCGAAPGERAAADGSGAGASDGTTARRAGGAAVEFPVAVWGPLALTPAGVAERAAAADGDVVAVGDGALRHREALAAAGVDVADEDSPAHAVSALAVCRLASTVAPVPAEAVLPDYLRAPDAVARPA